VEPAEPANVEWRIQSQLSLGPRRSRPKPLPPRQLVLESWSFAVWKGKTRSTEAKDGGDEKEKRQSMCSPHLPQAYCVFWTPPHSHLPLTEQWRKEKSAYRVDQCAFYHANGVQKNEWHWLLTRYLMRRTEAFYGKTRKRKNKPLPQSESVALWLRKVDLEQRKYVWISTRTSSAIYLAGSRSFWPDRKRQNIQNCAF
jgi:hypothetical protein